jgi:hypothetical protein
MPKHKIRISADVHDDDHRRLVKIRKHLHSYSSVGINPENPAYRIHRDNDGRAYFELSTDKEDEVERILRELGHAAYARADRVAGPTEEPCLNCGNIVAGQPQARCEVCGFRETSSCPHCARDISRAAYVAVAGDVLQCPSCHGMVTLHFNEPLFKANGDYNEPVVVVEAIPDAAE